MRKNNCVSPTASSSVSAYQFSGKVGIPMISGWRYRSGGKKDATRIYYLGKRYYRSETKIRQLPDDPTIGRWLSCDPAGQGWSPYAYCGNNPIIMVDPDGEIVFTALCLIIPGAQVFLPIAIGMDLGAISGGVIAYNTGQNVLQGVIIGATIGGISGGAALGISTISATALTSTSLSPGVVGFLSGAFGGGAGGYISGFGNAWAFGGNDGYFSGDIKRAHEIGINSAAVGGITGGVGGYIGNKAVKMNIPLPKIGGDVGRTVLKGLGYSNISFSLPITYSQLGLSLSTTFTPIFNAIESSNMIPEEILMKPVVWNKNLRKKHVH